jgi:CRP-like cAMP-binding protein
MEGSVKITQIDDDGNTVILRIVGPGEVIGELGGSRQIVHSSTAEARTSCKALVWSVPVFDSLTQRFPRLWNNTTRILVERLHNLEARFCEMSNMTVAQRLALGLGRLLPQVGKKVGEDVEIDLSREELAQMIGTTLFTVSRCLSLWEEQGIVSLRRLSVVIRNPFSLMTISEFK